MSEPLLDAQGCLTVAGLRALADASAGRAPAEVAQHLAACRRCQARALAGDAPAPAGRPPRPAPSLRVRVLRSAGLLLLALIVALAGILALRWVGGP